jgi:hypothetical protein
MIQRRLRTTYVGVARRVWLAILAFLVVSCAAAAPTVQHPSSTTTPVRGEHDTSAGCADTEVLTGSAMPAWAGVSDGSIPWAAGRPLEVVGVLFATELVAKGDRPDGSTNKILWVTRAPISSSQLTVHARPVDAGAPVVTFQLQGNQQFPSIIDLPSPGCWLIDISWGQGSAKTSTFGLTVLPAGSVPSKS